MNLLLHIGTEKTGTTVLQRWLYKNRDDLSSRGVYLSETLDIPNNRKIVNFFQGHFDDYSRKHDIVSQEDKSKFFKGFLSNLEIEIKSASLNHDWMIITSEHFHSRLKTDSQVRNFYNFISPLFNKIKVICYMREQSEMRISKYSTVLKLESSQRIDEFESDITPESPYYDHLGAARRWKNVFGRENVELRIYDRDRFDDGDICKDFVTALPVALDLGKPGSANPSDNESLYALEATAYRIINQNVPYWQDGKGVNRANLSHKNAVSRCPSLKRGGLVDDGSEAISRRFAESNAVLFREYFQAGERFADRKAKTVLVEDEQFLLAMTKLVEELVDALTADRIGAPFEDSDADILRDVALKFETGAELTREDAIALMGLALRCRPSGPLIRRKLAEWTA
jgi:hypothetical protein